MQEPSGTKTQSSAEQKERRNPITAVIEDGRIVLKGRSCQVTRDKNRALEPFGKVLLQYGKQLLILPDTGQAEQIRRTNGCARIVARDYLEKRQGLYNTSKEMLSVGDYKKTYLKALKEEKPFLKEVDKFARENAAIHIDTAFKNFLERHTGFPKNPSRYKPSGNRYTTISVMTRSTTGAKT